VHDKKSLVVTTSLLIKSCHENECFQWHVGPEVEQQNIGKNGTSRKRKNYKNTFFLARKKTCMHTFTHSLLRLQTGRN
jgi:hypothetical protein